MRNKVLVLVTLMLSSSHGYVSAYHVEPVKALLSGWSPLYENVTQTVTCNFDSLSYVELFCGGEGQWRGLSGAGDGVWRPSDDESRERGPGARMGQVQQLGPAGSIHEGEDH